MMKLFKKKKVHEDVIVKAVVDQTAALLTDLQKRMDFRFNELSAQVKELELEISQLETKLLTKDLKDKQAYGLLHYKLHEVKHDKLHEEIALLETALQDSKGKLKDQ